jgi:phosphatidylserine/phosphatidylglycerophosphate/cardiolipin synthase-like enzyme
MGFKTVVLLLLLAFTAGFWIALNPPFPVGLAALPSSISGTQTTITPFFCPTDFCDQQLLQRIDSSQQSIDLAIYSFTLNSVSDALIEAHDRGVSVRVLFDASQASSSYSQDEKLEKAGVPIKRLDLEKGILHDKYIIIDHQLVGTGSFNYSENASHYNKENLVFINSSAIAQKFEQDFEKLWNES